MDENEINAEVFSKKKKKVKKLILRDKVNFVLFFFQ